MSSQALKHRAQESNLQTKLENELERLKKKADYGYGLKVVWLPNYNAKLSGEVKNGIIYIYESNENEAIKTLKHEFVDYVVSQSIEVYKSITNNIIQILNETAYERKEKVVETLLKLLDESD